MSKYLLVLGFFGVVWWIWRQSRTKPRNLEPRTSVRDVEQMVTCAHCGVNQPISESIQAHGRHYCCLAHQRDAESTPQ